MDQREIKLSIYSCGMSEETFTESIMISKPLNCAEKTWTTEEVVQKGITTLGDFVEWVKRDDAIRDILGEWGRENFNWQTAYIRCPDCLLGLWRDKPLQDIFDDVQLTRLDLAYFIVAGASIHNETQYRFTVHSDEQVHRNTPHVHVSKDGVDVRFDLRSLQPMDSMEQPHRRDYRKIIKPFLEKNQEKLTEMWELNLRGYITPQVTEGGAQFYPES